MDRTRTRRASLRRRPSQAPNLTFEELKPEFQWVRDDTHHRLLIHFPGFVRQQIKVEGDKSGKVIKISGSRLDTENNRFITVDQSYQVPEDAILDDEMTMEFQDGLYLTIILPLIHQKTDGQKDADVVEEEIMPKKSDDRKLDNIIEPADMEKPKIAGLLQESKDYDDGDTVQKSEVEEEEDHGPTKKDDEPATLLDQEEMPKSDEKLQELLEKHSNEAEEGPKAAVSSRKRKAVWTGLLHEKKRSRRMIAVAVVAFSLGFYASHMLSVASNHGCYQ